MTIPQNAGSNYQVDTETLFHMDGICARYHVSMKLYGFIIHFFILEGWLQILLRRHFDSRLIKHEYI
jgi:hypothetical protein